MIKRDIYLEKLISAKENGFPKVITGVKRCGKSYLLTTIFKQYLISRGYQKLILLILHWMNKKI